MGGLIALGLVALAGAVGVGMHLSEDAPRPPRRRRGGMLSKLEHDPSKPEGWSALREPWQESIGLETRDPREGTVDDPRAKRDDGVRLEDFDIR